MIKNRGKPLDDLVRCDGELLRAFAALGDRSLLPLPFDRLLGSQRCTLLALLLADLLASPSLMVVAALRHTCPP